MGQLGIVPGGNSRTFWATLHRLFWPQDTWAKNQNQAKSPEIPEGLPLMPMGERVALAFKAIPATETEKKAIAALMQRPGADSKTLSEACGWSQPIWHTHFGLMCQKRMAWLWPSDLPDEPDAQFLPDLIVVYNARSGTFRMKAEVEAAFRDMGLS
jgi:hypothetical protein